MVYEIVPTNAYTFYEKYEPIVRFVREEGNYPHYFRPIEYLADEMKKIAQSRGESEINFDIVYKPDFIQQ
jgi:hypothetical protein